MRSHDRRVVTVYSARRRWFIVAVKERNMPADEDFGELCTLVAALARHVEKLALGTQGLAIHREINEIGSAAERLRDKSSKG